VLPAAGGYRRRFPIGIDQPHADMAEIGDEFVRDVLHREPLWRAGVILTHKPAQPVISAAGTAPSRRSSSLQSTMFSEILSWRSLLRQPGPFNGRSTIGARAASNDCGL
jgi:hypothetical protein